ncbi:5'-3' exoribonuclease 2 isoform X2 [Amblyraja radiata]|uniref:5'-3' exoribonuclease 2 isoform X2 n=1 Tax=Amblyraja radiata TaxID=386614 RepID=UPI001402E1CA|nr:5'-3' exoribonuclease 2 isoform X2 [Amblyraja radiata]
MGVPAFFRWLSRKYPSIVVHCVEEKAKEVNGVKVPVDCSKPNPNDVEFDNLYLDMNGIIHPCTHPENKPAPKNEDEMMVAIFEYIDRLFNIIRPRRLLYMAIDGVAPRAKMNQQRSRRFRASKEGMELVDEKKKVREEVLSKGGHLPSDEAKERFDSNCITPGTEFMDNLAQCLRYYVADRLNSDPGWKDLTVLLSDASVPGEGEHKIMDYIRRQRAQPNHDPNTRHCLCGADADLIMLGLATHEVSFTIIREEFKPNQPRPCPLCAQVGHELSECQGLPKEKQGEFDQFAAPSGSDTEFIFIRLPVLREYLEKELTMASLPFTFDFERSIDDWVFMCFFVGNDFLPHLPSLEIREGAIDRLVGIYKNVVHKTGGYLTENGFVNLERVQMIMTAVGEAEDNIFKRRREDDVSFRRRMKEKNKRMKTDAPSFIPGGQLAPQPLGQRSGGSKPQAVQSPRQTAYDMRVQNRTPSQNSSTNSDGSPVPLGMKRKNGDNEDDDDEPPDNIRLWEDGWKQRYYKRKFDVDATDETFRRKVVESYVEGLCWVLQYYYQGCASWKWFYPFHYAPFASDFTDIKDMPSTFEKGTLPFKPLEQLMGVFPAASGNFLPKTWRVLMEDPDSSIIDFYPDDFALDLNGKKYAWQGVALLPFVDERRLRAALEKVYPDLAADETRRNSLGSDVIFVGKQHKVFDFIAELQNGDAEGVEMPPELCHGIKGLLTLANDVIKPGKPVASPIPALNDIVENNACSILFKDPQFEDDYIFKATLIPTAVKLPKTLKPGDWEQSNSKQPWRPRLGFNPNRQQVHLDQSAFRTLGHVMSKERTQGVYSYTPPPSYQQAKNSRPPLMRAPPSLTVPLPSLRPQDSWRGPQPLFQQLIPQRNQGVEQQLAWNRIIQSQGGLFQQNTLRLGSGVPGYFQQRQDDRRGRQGFSGRPYPLPPDSGRFNWN